MSNFSPGQLLTAAALNAAFAAKLDANAASVSGDFTVAGSLISDTIKAGGLDGLTINGGSNGVTIAAGPLVIPTIGRFLLGNGATTNASGTLGWLQRNQLNITGTITDTAATLNDFEVPSDTADASGAANTPAYMGVNANFGGAGFGGGRAGQRNQITQTGTVSGGSFTAANFWMNGGGYASPDAQYYSGNFQCQIAADSGSIGLAQGGGEVNIQIASGNTVAAKAMWTLVQESGDAVQGTSYDTALGISNQGECVGWQNAISIGRYDGVFPLTTSGTVFGTYVQEADGAAGRDTQFPAPKCFAGVDFQNLNFSKASGYAFRAPGWSIDGTGQISTANALIGTTSTGVKIDIPNSIVTAVAVSAGGSGYYVGDIVYDSWGGQYEVATVSGSAVTSLNLLVPGVAASAQTNPAATTGGSGLGLTLTLTWSANSTLSLNPTGQTTAFWSTLNANATGTSGSYDGQIKVAGGGSQAGQGVLNHTAAQHNFYAYDSTPQFSVGLQPGAAEYWQAQGGTTGIGANLFATNGTLSGNVDGNYVTQGTGNHWFGTGAGTAFKVADPGSTSTGYLIVTPSISGTNPKLSSSTSTTQIDGATVLSLTVGGVQMATVENPNSVVATANYVRIFGASTGNAPGIRAAGDTNTPIWIRPSGTASMSVVNDQGAIVTFANSVANTVASTGSFRAGSTTTPVIFQSTSNNVAIGGTGGGAAPLDPTATAGFAGIPTVSGTPTGTPAQSNTAYAYVVYNSASQTLNIYDNTAGAWRHIATTAGAG